MLDGRPQLTAKAASPSERTTFFILGAMRCYPTFTSTSEITFHIKPLPFHYPLLWVSPIAFVARDISRYRPRPLGVQDAFQRRHDYFPASGSSRASVQVPPPSTATSPPRNP